MVETTRTPKRVGGRPEVGPFLVALGAVVLSVVNVAVLGAGALAVGAGACGLVAVGMAVARPYLFPPPGREGADDA